MNDRTKLDPVLDDLFGIDTRGLAAFRIALGALLCLQAALKLREFSLPAEGSITGWLDLDFCLLLGCGAAIAAGKHVRLACVVGWPFMFRHIMLDWQYASVHIHRYLLLIGLFWLALAPCDRIACLGSSGQGAERVPRRALSFATAALLVQIFFVYFSGGAAKAHVEWVVRADALENLMQTHFATPLGRSLLAFPWLLRALSAGTIVLEMAGPVACFVPCRRLPVVRNVVLAAMTAFHLGLALTMHLETIPLVCQAYWLLMVPSTTWDRIWPRADLAMETQTESAGFVVSVSRTMLAGMCLSFLLSLAVTADPSGMLLRIHQATPKIGLYQDWRMFRSPATLRKIDEEAARRANS